MALLNKIPSLNVAALNKKFSLEVQDQLLSERWGGVKVIAHNEIFDAQSLPALVAGEKDSLATFRIQQSDQSSLRSL
jgi:hypothetical protein